MRGVLLLFISGCGRLDFDPLSNPVRDPLADAAPGDVPDGIPTAYREAVLADAPLAYFRFDDPDTTAREETGRYTGTNAGGCTPGLAGLLANDASTAVRFDGTSCRITLTGNLGFQARAPFSVEAWTRQETVGTFQTLFMNELRQGGNPRDGYGLVTNTEGVFLERVVSGTNRLSARYPSQVGVTTHYVGVYDGSALHLYVDGVEMGAPQPDTAQVDQSGSIPVIGNYPIASGDVPLHGVLDEVAIYDKALGADRIAVHFAIGRNGPQ